MSVAIEQLPDLCKTDLQKKVIAAVIESKDYKAASDRLGMTRKAISKTINRVRRYATTTTKPTSPTPEPQPAQSIFSITGNFRRFSFVTDTHGDMCDWKIWRRYMEFDRQWKPHLRIHGGDAMDLRPYRKGAGPEEKLERITDDMVAFRRLFEEYRPDVWLQGNHDARMTENAQSCYNPDRAVLCQKYMEEIEQLCAAVCCDVVLPYHVRKGIYQVGDLSFAHGYKTGVNCARAMGQTYGNVIFGHVHTYQRVTLPTHEEVTAISSPVMAKMDMEYLDRCVAALQHRQGWTYGVINDRTGSWEAWSAIFDESGNWIDPFAILANLCR